MDFGTGFALAADDDIYVCGTVDALNRFYDSFQQGEQLPAPVPA